MSDAGSIRGRLNTIFQEVFDDDSIQISDETTAQDIDDWDSVAHITLVLSVEEEFGVQLNAAEVGKLENVGAMVKLLIDRGC